MAKLVIKGTTSASRLWLARRMVTRLAAELPGRRVHVTADSAYAGDELKQLPDGVTWTTRLRSNAALYGLPPERTGKKGRPRVKGDRLPSLAKIAAASGVLAGHRHPLRQDRDHRRRTRSPACGTPSPARSPSPSSSSATSPKPGSTSPSSPRKRTRASPG